MNFVKVLLPSLHVGSLFRWLPFCASTDVIVPDPTCILLPPHVSSPEISAGFTTKIIVCLSTHYEKSVTVIHQNVKMNNIESWGKVQHLDGGDTMNASALVKSQEDQRDASYVRVHADPIIVLFTHLI